MKRKFIKTSVTLSPVMAELADELAEKAGITRSELFRRMIVAGGVNGVTCGVTDQFLLLSEPNQERILDEIRVKLKLNDHAERPQSAPANGSAS